jgi:uncharacterized protein DUF5681
MPLDRDYQVGYRKPPEHTRFRKGRSGNPRGRPARSKNLATIVAKALDEPVVVSDNGRRRRITKREAIITQLVNRSAQADLKAMQLLLGMLNQIERRGEHEPPEPTGFAEADLQIIEELKTRFRSGGENELRQ